MPQIEVNTLLGRVDVTYSYEPADEENGYKADELVIDGVEKYGQDVTELLSEQFFEMVEGEIRNG